MKQPRPVGAVPLVSPNGKKVPLAELSAPERSGPTLAGVRDPVGGNPAAGLTPARLAVILRSAAEGEWNDYLELAEAMEERDLHYRAVLGVRKRSVAQLPINVEAVSDEPAHEEHADLIRRWLKRGTLRKSLFDVLDAVGKGFSVHEIIWDSKPSHVWPAQLHYRPQRWFEADLIDRDTPRLRQNGHGEDLPPHRYLLHIHKDKSGAVIRSGIAYAAAWGWMMKRFTDHDWAQFVRAYGMPIRVGKYDGNTTEEDRDILWRAVANIGGDMAAIIPDSMKVEFVSAMQSGANPEVHARRCEYIDQQISKLVLGQTTTTDAISGGHAVSQEHREVAGDIERADALLLSSVLTEQLVPWIISLNFGPQDDYPVISIGRPDEMPIKDWIEAIKALAPEGLKVEVGQIYDRLGIEEPSEGAQTIGGVRPQGGINDPLADLFAKVASVPEPMRRTLELMAAQAPEKQLAEAMLDAAAREASPALGDMTAEIRKVFESATSMEDLKTKLDGLKLDPKAFADAMGRGIALSHMAGRAALMEDLEKDSEG